MLLKCKQRRLQLPHKYRSKNNNMCVTVILRKKHNTRRNIPHCKNYAQGIVKFSCFWLL